MVIIAVKRQIEMPVLGTGMGEGDSDVILIRQLRLEVRGTIVIEIALVESRRTEDILIRGTYIEVVSLQQPV
jgi:hypothetical protein